jgi:hypothetical protein
MTIMTTLPYNPYDFANPVTDERFFAGRNEVLEDIEYYLNHAANAPQAINLALTGERASGKTSLLNMIEVKANAKNIIPVRINLDEGDAVSPLRFFTKFLMRS